MKTHSNIFDFKDLNLNINGQYQTLKQITNLTPLLQKQNQLTVIQINIRSIRKHWDSFLAQISPIIKYIDVIVITEINILDTETFHYNIKDFTTLAKCRKAEGGGLLLLHRTSLTAETIETSMTSAETLCVNLKAKDSNFVILACYRPPDKNVNTFNNELDKVLDKEPLKSEKNMIIIGDINICYLKKTYGTENYLSVLYSKGITNTIKDYTREETRKNAITRSCIDHINIRLPNYDYNSYVIQQKVADHYMTVCSVKTNDRILTGKPTHVETISNDKVKMNMHTENWWPILDLTDPEKIYDDITKKFDSIYNNSKVKIKISNNHKYTPWLNKTIKNLIKEKNDLWQQVKKNQYNTELKNHFKIIRNKLTNEIRTQKRKFYFQKFSEAFKNTKDTWKLVHELVNKKPRPTIETNIKQNFKVETKKEIHDLTENFNNSFKNQINNIKEQLKGQYFDLSKKLKPDNNPPGENTSMNFRKMTEIDLINIMDKLKLNSSPGPDNIRPKDIKENINILKLPILHLMNKIIETGKIPQKMKITHLRPIYKNGKKTDPNNYRPIGSLSVIMKILEHHIKKQMQKYLTEHNIISDTQFGFVPKKSTQDLLELLTNKINKALSDKKVVVAISLDLTKAFDLIDYKQMINKLKKIGIGGKLLQLFISYFTDRTLNVSIGETISSSITQLYGLIQGSILSPLLFNIFVNDFAKLNFNGEVLQYADDTILFFSHTQLNLAIQKIQQDLNLAVQYFFENSIKLNGKKTKAIIFKCPRTHMDALIPIQCHDPTCLANLEKCNCPNLTYSESIKHLGIELDQHLKYNHHIDKLTIAMRRVLFQSYRIKNSLPISTKRVFYFSMTESLLRYGLTLYYTAPNYIIQPLRDITEKIIKVLFNGIPINILGLMTLDNLAKYIDITRNYYDENLRKTQDTEYNLRNHQYTVEKCTNNYSKNLPEYKIPKLLNEIPESLKNIDKIARVKIELKTFFLQNKETQKTTEKNIMTRTSQIDD